MRVLLTGAAGFIGGRVWAALLADGHEVVAVDALLDAAHGSGSKLPEGCQRLDVRDADALARLLDGVDVVCHQAAVVGAGVNAADAPAYASHNDYGTAVLLAQMFQAGVQRLVLASSMVVYGQGGYACPVHGVVDPLPRTRADLDAGEFEHRCPVGGEELVWQLVDEDAPLRPRSLYAASKTAQEHYSLAWSESSGGSVVALRYHNVYGPGMPRDTPYSGVAAIFRSSLEQGEAPKVFEDGGQMRDFVHVEDVAAANVAALALGGRWVRGRQRLLGPADLDHGGRRPVVRGPRGPGAGRHRAVPQRRRPPHRRRPGSGQSSGSASAAAIDPGDGLREFAFAPLRA